MARNHRTALYLNDPIKWIAGVLSIRQVVSLAAIGGLAYGLVKLTGRLPYDKSTAGQLHLMLVICVPGLLAFLAWSLLDKGAVEPYPKQLAGYLLRTAADLPRRLALAGGASVLRATDTARQVRARHDAARAARPPHSAQAPRTVKGQRLPAPLRALTTLRRHALTRPSVTRPSRAWPLLTWPARIQDRLRTPATPTRRRDKTARPGAGTAARPRRPARPADRYVVAYRGRGAHRRQQRRRRALATREAS
jgi:hypothetical protein